MFPSFFRPLQASLDGPPLIASRSHRKWGTAPCSALLLFLLLVTPPASSQTFTPSIQDLPGLWSGSLEWGDFDGDGDADLALVGLTGPSDNCEPISRIYRNDGGTLSNLGADLIGVYLGAAAWGDYDGDGDLDLALTGLDASGSGVLEIYENDGGQFVEDLSQTELIAVRYSALAWSDMDRDGDLDLIVTGMTAAGNPSSVLYRNDRIDADRIGRPLGGSALLKVDAANTERLISLNQGAVAWGDVDGDADPDLALSGFGKGGVRQTVLYLNENGSLARDDRNTDLTPLSRGDLAWGDVDNDGDLDLVASGWSNEWEATLQVFDNAAGILRENSGFSSTRVVGSLAWGDYDNDGDLDLAVSGQTSTSTRASFLLRNNPLGTLLEDQALTGLRGGDAAWADVDGDGSLDLLLSGENEDGTRQTILYAGSAAVANTAPTSPTRLSPPAITGDQVSLSWNDGRDLESSSTALTYTLRIGTSEGGNDVFSGAVPVGPGNVGGNRIVDLTIPVARDRYYWSIRTVDPAFSTSTEFPEEIFVVQDLVSSAQSLRPVQNSAMAWGDFDNDGDVDLALVGRDLDGVARGIIYQNDAGALVENRNLVIQGVQDGSVAWGDFDNDGDLDLAVTGADAGGNRVAHVYRNRLESNDFALVGNIVQNLTPVGFSSVAWGDYDSDGDLDLAIMGQGDGERLAAIYTNNAGTFKVDPSQVLVGMDNGRLAWADYDNDGDLDLAAIGQINNQSDARAVVYRNEPIGTLTEDTRSTVTGLFAGSLAWGDLENDGDQDLAICGFNNQLGFITKIYLNSGAGQLTDSGLSLPGVAGSDLAWGDFDNDGDLDLALAGAVAQGQVLQIYRNSSGTLESVPVEVLLGVQFASISWADYDNDLDLDLTSSGVADLEGTFLPVTRANDNLESRFNPNRPPSAPHSLLSAPSGSEATLTWSASDDLDSTPEAALTYDLRLGTTSGGHEIMSGATPTGTGVLRSSSHRLRALPSGTYFWSVRGVDNGFARSSWSEEDGFIIDTIKPVVDSVRVRPRSLADANRLTVFVTFIDEPAGMDNRVAPRVTAKLSGRDEELVLRQVGFNGNLWVGDVPLRRFPSGTAIVTIRGARDLNGNEMDPHKSVLSQLVVPRSGGVVQSGDGLVNVTIFPSLTAAVAAENPSVVIEPISVSSAPEGATAVGIAYEIRSNPVFTPDRASTLSFRVPSGSDASTLAIFRLEGNTWTRVGGTPDPGTDQIRVSIEQFGVYALFQGGTELGGGRTDGSAIQQPRLLRDSRPSSGIPACRAAVCLYGYLLLARNCGLRSNRSLQPIRPARTGPGIWTSFRIRTAFGDLGRTGFGWQRGSQRNLHHRCRGQWREAPQYCSRREQLNP